MDINKDRLYQLKKDVYAANLELVKQDLVIYTWGNVSVVNREEGYFVIKPSGVNYDTMKIEDMVAVDFQGQVIEGNMKPSSDTPTHLVLYQGNEEIQSVVHTHSDWATSWAQACRAVPAYGTTHADYFYGEILCTRVMSQEEVETDYEVNTGKVILESMEQFQKKFLEVPGILVANHGPFSWGKSQSNAVHNAKVLEVVCKMAVQTEKINEGIRPVRQYLLNKHYLRKHGKSAYYGQLK